MPRKRKEIVQLLQQTRSERSLALDVSHCQLGELLEEVCQMDWLTELDLSHCHLAELPEMIGNLTHLTRLSLAENQLATLPESITRLAALQSLDLERTGYEFAVSETVLMWLRSLPEVQWPEGKPLNTEEEAQPIFRPDHPNRWLEWLKEALGLYGVALAMEDRSFSGYDKRKEGDALIGQIFRQVPELQEILPEFYQDFQEQRFYPVNRDSEKTLNHNPFRLPTPEDEKWVAGGMTDVLPLSLRKEIREVRCHVLVRDDRTGKETEVFQSEYGRVEVWNQPHAEDEEYFADCEAWLYQAGPRRLYVRIHFSGYGGDISLLWYGRDDAGQAWQKQAKLTQEWLEGAFPAWRELGHVPYNER